MKVDKNSLKRLEKNIKKGKPNFVLYCFDLPSENKVKDNKILKRDLLLRRKNFSNRNKKFGTYVSDSVYIVSHNNIKKLINTFEDCYSDVDVKQIIKFDILGLMYDEELVKRILTDFIENVVTDTKDFFDFIISLNVEDCQKLSKSDWSVHLKKYKKCIREINVIREHKLNDLNEIDKSKTILYHEKINKLMGYRGNEKVLRKLNNGIWYV